MRVEVVSDQGIVAVHDRAIPAPGGAPRGSASAFRKAAREGKLFFLEAEDPLRCRIDVYVGEAPEGPPHGFQPRGGSFHLDLPTGGLVVRGFEDAVSAAALTVAPGAYVLRVFAPPEFDGPRHEREMIALVGERAWRFHRRVDWLGAFGCLPIVAAFGAVLVPRWRWPFLYAFPLALLTVAPHFLLKRTRRYRDVDGRLRGHELAKPHWILALTPAAGSPGIEGGFVAV